VVWGYVPQRSFPGLFNISRIKDASIANNSERSNDSIQWNVAFTHGYTTGK
jgi:hypothetical protein